MSLKDKLKQFPFGWTQSAPAKECSIRLEWSPRRIDWRPVWDAFYTHYAKCPRFPEVHSCCMRVISRAVNRQLRDGR